MRVKKYSSTIFILVNLLAIILLISCSDAATTESDTTLPPDNITESADEQQVITETQRPALDIPINDYEGYVFRTLSYAQGTPGSWGQYLDFGWSTEAAGDLINDAVYMRNLIVEERYNIVMENTQVPDAYTTARNTILAGSDDYDIVSPYIDASFKLAQDNLLVDFFTIPYIDLEQRWWDQAIMRDLAINNKIYAMTGDISMNDEELNYGIFFNKALISEYTLDDPYQIVRDDKWNLDTMAAMGRQVTHDLNGDGIVDEFDVYGVLTDYGVAPVWYFGLGAQMAQLNNDGVPELSMNDERTNTVIEKLSAFLTDSEVVLNVSNTVGSWTGFDDMLMTDRALFRAGSIYDIQFYRSMVNDFGILPHPKLDEAQKDFFHIIATQVCYGICVPTTATNLERTGIILEALAYESKDTVTKAYYDINLYTKVARDNESGEMFDIIFGTKRYDLCKAFGWGGMEDVIRNASKDSSKFASLYTAAESKAESEMRKTYEFFSE
jgi:hypothetical protein